MPQFTTMAPFFVTIPIREIRQKENQTRQQYLRLVANFARKIFARLRQLPEYRRSHESFAVRDAMLCAERQYVDCGTFGVEHIDKGSNRRSPEIEYLNTGDTYDLTVLYVNGRFRVGCCGDIVERGDYA